MTDCIFCSKIEPESLIKETDNFFVYMGKGLITAGHVMIIPKKHYRCMAELEENKIDEFFELKNSLYRAIEKSFATPFFLEHGIFGQTVFHAHLHAIPSSGNGFSNVNIIDELVLPVIEKLKMPFVKLDDFSELKKVYQEDGEYLYYEQNGEKYALRTKGYNKDDIRNDVIYRAFFTNKKGVKGVNGLKYMSDEDWNKDNEKRLITKDKLAF